MARKNADLGSLVKEGADELRGAVEKVLAERPMLVLGLALELGLLAGDWVKGNKISLRDIAKRAIAATPDSIQTALHFGGNAGATGARQISTRARRKPTTRGKKATASAKRVSSRKTSDRTKPKARVLKRFLARRSLPG